MTDPTGRAFLSYRRSRREEAERLLAALHDVGVPTWRDIEDLGPEPTAEALRTELASPETACAVMLVTPETESSETILQIEAPLILERARRDPGFFALTVAAGGLDYEAAARVLRQARTLEDARGWNLHRVEGELDAAAATEVAGKILRERLRRIHAELPSEAPLQLGFYTRRPVRRSPGTALCLDWTGRFDGRETRPGAWEAHLLPAVERVAVAVGEGAPGRAVEARGLPALPAATALGVAFQAPRAIPLFWMQYKDGVETPWALHEAPEDSGFTARLDEGDLRAEDLAVLVSVADNVEPAVERTKGELPAFRGWVRVEKPGDPPHELTSAGEAVDVARKVSDALRRARRLYGMVHTVHLFTSVPAGLAVMIGQLLNTWDRVQTYELLGEKETARYRPAALLRPNR